MLKWQLVGDSSCDVKSGSLSEENIGFDTVPLKILVGDKEFVDIASTDPMEMLSAVKQYNGPSSSACPSPGEFAEQFKKAECSFAVTLTGQLSGSYNAALQAKSMVLDEYPEKKIHVIDSLGTSGSITLILNKIKEFIAQGMEFEEIVRKIDQYRDSVVLVFALGSYDMLIKNGRMSRVAGIMAGVLNIRAVSYNPGGVIKVLEKPRGEKKAIERMVALAKERFAKKPNTPVIVTHCNNPKGAKELCDELKKQCGVEMSEITILECACLTSYYAGDQGLLLAFEGTF